MNSYTSKRRYKFIYLFEGQFGVLHIRSQHFYYEVYTTKDIIKE